MTALKVFIVEHLMLMIFGRALPTMSIRRKMYPDVKHSNA